MAEKRFRILSRAKEASASPATWWAVRVGWCACGHVSRCSQRPAFSFGERLRTVNLHVSVQNMPDTIADAFPL